ncbi:hypothetical protein R6Q59_023382 [Mikania micrantha]
MEKIKHLKIPLNEIKLATADKYTSRRDVYKAELGEIPKKKVFIKRFSQHGRVLRASFIEKIEMLAYFEHPSNQVSFLGFCDEEYKMLLVFEYTFEENLEYYWDTGCEWDAYVTWRQRIRLCLEIARGLLLTTMISIVEIHPLYSVFLQEYKSLGLPDEDVYLFGLFLFRMTASCDFQQLKEVLASGIASIIRLKDMVKEEFMIPCSVIATATENFDTKYLITSGGFGEVYKAKLNLSDIESCYGEKFRSRCNSSTMMQTVAIKRLHAENVIGENNVLCAFAELDALCECEDPNIVTLLAYCEDEKEMLLVYEYACNGSLESQFDGTNKNISFRQWTQRLKICIDIAEGLEYLHTNTEAKRAIVHGDIRSKNILLFENMKAKIAGVGLSKVYIGQESTIYTRKIVGTPGYMDPVYKETCMLKNASDIYSFGVVLFEIFSGKLAFDDTYILQNYMGFASIARRHFKNKTLKKMLDVEMMDEASELGLTFKIRPDHDSLDVFSNIAYQCVSTSQDKRPTIQAVIQDLKKALELQVS